MVASDQTGLLLIASDGETSAFLYRLYLVGDVAAEFLGGGVCERRDPPAQGEDGLLQMRDMLLQAGHPVLVVLDVIAIGQTERLGGAGEYKSERRGDDGCDSAHATLPWMSLKRSEAARGPWRSWRGWRQASECVRLEHFIDIAVPGAMRAGKQPVCRRTLSFNRLDQWVERGALVLALAVEPRAPPQASAGHVHRLRGAVPGG